jgi:hypothetical protein
VISQPNIKPSASAAAEDGVPIAEQTLPKATIEALAAEVNGKVEYQTTTTDVEGSWFWTDGPNGGKYQGQSGSIRTRARIVSDWIEVSG